MPTAPATDPASGDRPGRAPRWRAGIDIGGTFTDLLLADDATGEAWFGKVLTTPDDPARGVAAALAEALGLAGADTRDLATVIHGTTLVTNALIQRKGDRTALVTTRGFRDAVEIAREHRYDMYDLQLDLPRPLAPRHLRFEVDERLRADGTTYAPLDLASVDAVADALRDAGFGADAGAVAVCLLHAYRNPAHERAVADRLRERLPGVRVSLSHEVAGEIREYERTSTTLANVYVQRLMEGYLGRIEATLAAAGSPAHLLLMLSAGGTATVETARRFPVRLVESGPAAGALAAAAHGAATGRPNLLSFDMGGTTAKACLVTGGIPPVTTEFEVDRVYRFKAGSGLPVRVPSIDLIEIGAGGGSVARVDRFGLVKVGPDSAGADPGPACYGRGGTLPTVTDADLMLGYLDAGHFLGGAMPLDLGAARHAIAAHVGAPAGLDVTGAAWAIHQVVNEAMAAAARMHAVERGKDAAAVPLFAFGGAGPVHAAGVARLLGSREIVVPHGAGVGSTIGFLVAPVSFDFVRSYYARLDAIDWGTVASLVADMESEGRDLLAASGIDPDAVTFAHRAELRLVGQAHQVTVDLPMNAIDALRALAPGAHDRDNLAPLSRRAGEGQGVGASFAHRPLHARPHEASAAATTQAHDAIIATFAATYRTLYRRDAPPVAIEAVNWRVVARGPVPSFALPRPTPGPGVPAPWGESPPLPKGHRLAWWPETGQPVPTAVHDRAALAPGMVPIPGPAIIEERESTTVVPPGATVEVEASGALVIRLPGRRVPGALPTVP